MADNEQGGTNSVLGQQAQGDTGRKRDPVPPLNPTQGEAGGQTQGSTGGQGVQQGFAEQGEGGQGFGATTDQLGENRQSYGTGTRHDASGGQGPQTVSQGAQGQTGVLGAGPSQSQGQPASPTTGGPDLSQGLHDRNANQQT